jgi:Flp pilus assembly protein TadG
MKTIKGKKKLTLLTFALDESGATAVFVALALTAICGFVALGLDVGHMVMAKSELQRTADAAALAGAGGLVPYNGIGTLTPTPDWTQGMSEARTIISNAANQVDSYVFSANDGTVDYGWWCLNTSEGATNTLPLPKARPVSATSLPEPAIQVTVSRNVSLYFAPLVGVSSPQTVTATAVAIVIEGYTTSGVPPITVTPDVAGGWSEDATFEVDPDTQTIKIQSNKGSAGWFNLSGDNDVPSVRVMTPLTVDQSNIYVVPGTKATLTDFITAGDTISIPIVDTVDAKVWRTIHGWARFKVNSVSANSMSGEFVSGAYDPNVTPAPGNPSSGLTGLITSTPHLVSP